MDNKVDARTWIRVTIIVAIIGCVGTLLASLIGILPDVLKATPPPPSSLPVNLSIPADAGWVGTGLILSAGQTVLITSEGVVDYSGQNTNDGNSNPNGVSAQNADGSSGCNKAAIEKLLEQELTIDCLKTGAPWGALVGKVGDGDTFLIGYNKQIRTEISGELFVGVNDCCSLSDNSGEFRVTISSP